jgi:antimicrobial peptide system SdpA family protein
VKYDRQWLSVSRRLLIALAAPIAVIALWTAAMQVPHNVLELPRTVFTDTSPPRKLDRAPYSEPHNSFGLDRAVRKQATELADLVGTIPDTEWRACSSDADCVNHAGPAKTIKNSMPDPSLCGTIVIVGSNIVPWGYRKVRTGSFQNTRSVRVEVQCSQ